ncbi:MAG: TonB-dependent receptor [Caulobacterales bacterium]
MTKITRGLLLGASAATLAFALGTAGSAVAADDVVETAPPAETVVAPVTITAERRTVNLQTAPVPATVISGDQLTQKGVYTVDQLQFTTPSLTVSNYGIGEDFNIRGIGKEETNVQTPSGIVVYRDGVATFPGFFTAEPYYDIANVEVLRGPQGTFAGQNASGGAIFITEQDPNFGGYHGWIEGQWGQYGDARLRAVANLPASDTFAVRVALNAEREDSFYHVTGPGTGNPGRLGEFNGRVSMLWQPNSAWKILFKNDFNYIDAGGIANSPIPIPAGPTFPTYASSAGLFDVVSDVNNYARQWFNRSVLNISYTFGDGIVLRSITGMQFGYATLNESIDNSATGGALFAVSADENIYSEEVNLISPDKGPLKWVVGGYYQYDRVHIPFGLTGFDIKTPPLDILLDYTTPKTTAAVFGQVSYDVTDALTVVAGARYTHSTFTLSDRTALLLFGLSPSQLGFPFNVLFPDSEIAHAVQTDDKVTGKVDVDWKINPNNFLYAFVATGHKPGGINTTPVPYSFSAFPVHPFAPEDLVDYEIGWKATLADGHIKTQLDAFYTTYQRFQLTYTSVAGAAPGQSIIQNVPGTTTIDGIEAQAQAVFGALAFDVSADYLNSRLGSTAGTCPLSGVHATSPSCLQNGLALGFENIGGRQQPYAPPWSFNIGAQYLFHIGDNGTITPRINYGYVGAQWTSPFQGFALERYLNHLAPLNLLNAELAWDKAPYHVTLFGTNLLDDRYFYPQAGANAFTLLRAAAPPLQWGIRVSRDF